MTCRLKRRLAALLAIPAPTLPAGCVAAGLAAVLAALPVGEAAARLDGLGETPAAAAAQATGTESGIPKDPAPPPTAPTNPVPRDPAPAQEAPARADPAPTAPRPAAPRPETAVADPTPHEARYTIHLDRAGGGVLGAVGQMTYRFADTCDGWTVETRNRLLLTDDRGEQVDSEWNFLSWEARDGLSYRFVVSTTRDGEEIERIAGRAALDGPGQGGTAAFAEPEEKSVPLPAGTLFPTEHTIELVRQALQGNHLILRPVFDGTILGGSFDVSAAISRTLSADEPDEFDSPLLVGPSWRMSLAYFRPEEQTPLPYHELGVRYHENGVAQGVTQDYTDFRLRLTLEALETLPRPDC